MEFEKIVDIVLNEDMTAGGAGSVLGPNVGSTATEVSGDNLATGDSRIPTSIFGGVLKRSGMSKTSKSKPKKKYHSGKYKKKSKRKKKSK
jgi:hypothetical protein